MYSPLVYIKSPVTSGQAYFWSPDYNDAFLFKAAKINLLFSSYYWQSKLRSVTSRRKIGNKRGENRKLEWEASFDKYYWHP